VNPPDAGMTRPAGGRRDGKSAVEFIVPSCCRLVLAFVILLAAPRPVVARQATVRFACGAEVHAGEAHGTVAFPQDESFCPLIADPKEIRSFVGVQRGEFRTISDPEAAEGTTLGSVGLGDRFGLLRWGGGKAGDGFQIAIAGAIFAQFDLSSRSFDLINADYLVGLPLTFRFSGLTARLRAYHQSSHLGDEYLLRPGSTERENLSFESIEVLLSQELGPLRVYGGGENLFRREPDSVEPRLAHAGIELRTPAAGAFALLAGLDMKATQQHDWRPAWSARAGIQIAPAARAGHPLRHLLLLAEYYQGPSPYGQFFQDDIRYAGIALHLIR
jgi:Protein of unknown function (DUF1207)